MKRSRIAAALLFFSVCGLAWAGAVSTDAGDEAATVADFLRSCAQVVNMPLPAGAGPQEVLTALDEAGLVRGWKKIEVERTLTEGDLVRFAGLLGVKLQTSDDERPVLRRSLGPFFVGLSGPLQEATDLALDKVFTPGGRRETRKRPAGGE